MSGPTTTRPVLVIGGTGKTGRRVAERLEARGVPVRIGSRLADPPFDWREPATWGPALEAVRAVYITYYPDLAVPGAVEAIRVLAATALERDVTRLVLLSGRGEEEAARAEQALIESGADWTILRCAWFNQNFDENYLVDAVRADEIALPVGYIEEPFIDADDIADAAVAALTEHGHVEELYELTGPRLLTFADAAAEIAAATGREIRFREVSSLEYAAMLEAEGVPPSFLSLVTYLFREVMDGRNAYLTDGVRRALGREPRDFTDYAREAAASGVWDVDVAMRARSSSARARSEEPRVPSEEPRAQSEGALR